MQTTPIKSLKPGMLIVSESLDLMAKVESARTNGADLKFLNHDWTVQYTDGKMVNPETKEEVQIAKDSFQEVTALSRDEAKLWGADQIEEAKPLIKAGKDIEGAGLNPMVKHQRLVRTAAFATGGPIGYIVAKKLIQKKEKDVAEARVEAEALAKLSPEEAALRKSLKTKKKPRKQMSPAAKKSLSVAGVTAAVATAGVLAFNALDTNVKNNYYAASASYPDVVQTISTSQFAKAYGVADALITNGVAIPAETMAKIENNISEEMIREADHLVQISMNGSEEAYAGKWDASSLSKFVDGIMEREAGFKSTVEQMEESIINQGFTADELIDGRIMAETRVRTLVRATAVKVILNPEMSNDAIVQSLKGGSASEIPADNLAHMIDFSTAIRSMVSEGMGLGEVGKQEIRKIVEDRIASIDIGDQPSVDDDDTPQFA